MPDTRPQAKHENPQVVLGLLKAVEASENVTQRTLATELGVALGLANAYLRRCVKKGLVKVQQAPRRRYAYYLTPKGFAEKSRLTADYLSASFVFMKKIKAACADALDEAEERGWRKVVLIGASEVSEIALLGAHEHELDIVAIIDPGTRRTRFAGLPVWRHLDEAPFPIDGGILTVIQSPESWLEKAQDLLGADRVIVPDLLGTRPRPKPQGAPQAAMDGSPGRTRR